MTFALDKNPVCSMVPGSKLTGEPDELSANEGCQNKSAGQRHNSMKTYKKRLPLITLKKTKSDFPCVKIVTSADANEFIHNFYSDDIGIFESFFILLLNRNNNTIGYAKISQGGIVGTVIDATIIAKYCVEALATSVILAHNHPSGSLVPSQQDKDITRKIKDTLQIFDCRVLDHIILTEDSFFSFADEGLI